VRNAIAAVLAVSGLAAPVAAADAPGEYRVRRDAVQLALPNRGVEGTRTHNVREFVLDVPLLWAAAATLREPARIEADGETQELPIGTVLPLQMIGPAGVDPIAAYCTPRRAAERAAERGIAGALLGGGSLWRGMIRRATDRQACLIDTDRDGRVDSSVIVGEGSPEARRPRPTAPAAVEVAALQPIGEQDRLRIKLVRVDRRGRWADFELEIEQQGHRRRFDLIGGSWGSSNRQARILTGGDVVQPGDMVGTLFHVLAVDPAARTAQIRWSDKRDVDLPVVIPDSLRIVTR
jgi:hypothetical protein